MENNNNDIENKIFLSVKEKAKTLSREEVKKIIINELKTNGYEDWQAHYAVDRIEKMIEKENNPNGSKKVAGIGISSAIVLYVIYRISVGIFTDSTQELIVKTVKQVKTQITLPYQIDKTMTVVDITAEPNAVRYHYIFSGNSNNFTNDNFKKDLLFNVCLNESEKKILNAGINMEYSAIIKDLPQTFFVSITKEDCANYQIPLSPLKYDDLQPIKFEPQ